MLSVWLRVDGAGNSCARRTTGVRCTTSGSKIGIATEIEVDIEAGIAIEAEIEVTTWVAVEVQRN